MNIILLGAPGAGKGTQSEMISSRYNLPKLTTGQMIRDEIEAKTPLGSKIKDIVESGEFVSDDIMLKLVDKRLSQPDAKDGMVFDGYPRTINQVESLEKLFRNHYGSNAGYLSISLKVTDEEIIKRVSGRFTCKSCGAGYHNIYKPTKIKNSCDECNSSDFIWREDDKKEAIKKRIAVYKEKYTPVLEYYKEKGILKEVDGMQSIEAISDDIINLIDKSIVKSDYMNFQNKA